MNTHFSFFSLLLKTKKQKVNFTKVTFPLRTLVQKEKSSVADIRGIINSRKSSDGF